MKKILILLLFLPFWIFGQNNTVIEPRLDAQSLGGFLPSYYVDTATAQNIYGVKTFFANPIISNATPQLSVKDSDATAGDVNATFKVTATDTGDGTEDIDVQLEQQVAGTLARWIFSDADQGIYLYPLGEAANPVSITTGGAVTIPGTLDVQNTMTLGNDAANISGQLNFVASDGDAGNVDITTSDYLTFNNFAGTQISAGFLSLAAGNSIYLDGGTHTRISESAADVMSLFAGGTEMLTLTEAATDLIALNGNTTITGTGQITTSGTILNGSDSIVDADAIYDHTSAFVTGLDFTNISEVQIFRATDTITTSAGHEHTEYFLTTGGTISGDLTVTGSITGAIISPKAYAYLDSNAVATSLTADTWAIINNFTEGGETGGVTFNSDTIHITTTGTYELEFDPSVAKAAGGSAYIEIGFSINGADPLGRYKTGRQFSSADVGFGAMIRTAILSAGDYVVLKARNSTNGDDMTFRYGEFEITKE